ncbi:Mariner Mos1 transposase [Eumeta japonica]|uniref:Mariner Mos1 transposase n=1 Tax=Eumeta variegata TaxID=151549 RepID=A0A4C1Z1X3_EUMVA|nr:Mariner Mos1 transposase [Eumeta japonica]
MVWRSACRNESQNNELIPVTRKKLTDEFLIRDGIEPFAPYPGRFAKPALLLPSMVTVVSRHRPAWQILPHPPYSPDTAPSDYHLFRSMAHALSEQRFTSYEDTENWVDSWIASKDKEFFRLEIRTLPERWKKVVASDGQYFD